MVAETKYYLTKEGFEKLSQEFEKLKEQKKIIMEEEAPDITDLHGPDAEYLTFQEDLGFVERRLEEIEAILKNCEILKPPPKHKRHIVHLGATVEVEIDGQKDEFTIVAPVEADPMAGKISHESPVGRALLGRSIGEKVVVQSSIRAEYKIRKITYKSIK